MKLQVPNHDLTNLTSDHISGIWCDLKPMINHIKHVNINHVNRFLAISMAKKIFSQYPNISEHFLTTNQKTYGGFLSHQGTPSHHPFFLGISHETIQLFLGFPHDYGKHHINQPSNTQGLPVRVKEQPASSSSRSDNPLGCAEL